MKKTCFLIFASVSLHACVVEESLDEIIENRTYDVSMQITDNSCIIQSGKKLMDIYTYDGKDGTLTTVGNRPAIIYEQKSDDWLGSGFQYAFAEQVYQYTNTDDLQYRDAFSRINITVSNEEKSLYLEVREVGLYNIATSGTFLFPWNKYNTSWNIDSQDKHLIYRSEIHSLLPGETVSLTDDNYLPVIPQYTDMWVADCNPQPGDGSYLLLDCRIFSLSESEKGFQPNEDKPIWAGTDGNFEKVAIPVQLDLKMNKSYTISLKLENYCPWYNIKGEVPGRILCPIVFDATVEDWQDGGDIYLSAD